MNFETLQQRWQQQETRSPAKVDASLVLQEVLRNHRSFERTIFWRDFREVGAALLATIYFVFRARGWTDYLLAAAAAGVGIYILVDRLRQRKNRPSQSESLRSFVEGSLLQVRHQSWLLRNVLWWYLLPLMVPVLISIAVQAETLRQGIRGTMAIVVLTWLIYKLNQNAVKTQLAPREQELERLLAGLKEAPVQPQPITTPC